MNLVEFNTHIALDGWKLITFCNYKEKKLFSIVTQQYYPQLHWTYL